MIWHVIDSSGLGGAERHITTLARSTIARGVQARAVLLADHGQSPWLDQLREAEVPSDILAGSWHDLYNRMRKLRPRLIHTHGYKAGIWARLAARLCSLPVVSTFHSGERSRGRVGLYEFADEWSAFLGNNIAVSSAVAQRLPLRAHVVPSYVEIPKASAPRIPQPLVAFVGRLSAEKRPDVFCQIAFAADRDIAFDVYGDGPMRATLERKYGSRVRFHGPEANMERVWPRVSLLVMPSMFEGLPLAALEAMAHGVPVLATAVGGLRNLVQHGQTGWLIDASQPRDAAAKIHNWRSLREDERHRMSLYCRHLVAQEYSEDEQFPRVVSVYREAGLGEDLISLLSRARAASIAT